MPPDFTLGLDLGQQNDYTALCCLQRRDPDAAGEPDIYDLTHLERWRGEPYTATPGRVERVMQAIRAQHTPTKPRPGLSRIYPPSIELVVDATGVGRAVLDVLRGAGLEPVAITITGGDQVTKPALEEYRVPKRDLVSTVAVLLQQRRLRIAAALPLAPTLREELANFKVTITAGGHDRYGAGGDALAWRERPHDDLVLAVALAAWFVEADAYAEPMIWT
jgi:hypothetical protein